MKILFLDIDGVVNQYFNPKSGDFMPELMLRLKEIIKKTGAKIVLHSTWRWDARGRDEAQQALKKYGMQFIDFTPLKPNNSEMFYDKRHEHIRAWLGQNPGVKKFAVLDDCPSAELEEHPETYFRTNCQKGITDTIKNKVIKHLGTE